MIVANATILGREAVLEYSPNASWKSWGIEREGRWDTFIFLGKFELVHTNHWQKKPRYLITLLGALVVALTSAAYANPDGLEVIKTWVSHGPQ